MGDKNANYVKFPTLVFQDKYKKISDIFLGDEITQIVYTISGKEHSFEMKQGLKNGQIRLDNFKFALDVEPVSEVEENKNSQDNDDNKAKSELQDVDENKMHDDNKSDDDSKDEPKYTKMVKKTRTFTQKSEGKDISIPVGIIATCLVTSIGSVASGGSLAPLLIPQLKDAVINASWEDNEAKEDIVEHFFVGNTYIFVEIKRKKTKKGKSFGVFGKKKIVIKAKTNYFYAEAENDAAKRKLQDLQQKEAEDALNYINSQKGWSG